MYRHPIHHALSYQVVFTAAMPSVTALHSQAVHLPGIASGVVLTVDVAGTWLVPDLNHAPYAVYGV